jgi:hypothetical protein
MLAEDHELREPTSNRPSSSAASNAARSPWAAAAVATTPLASTNTAVYAARCCAQIRAPALGSKRSAGTLSPASPKPNPRLVRQCRGSQRQPPRRERQTRPDGPDRRQPHLRRTTRHPQLHRQRRTYRQSPNTSKSVLTQQNTDSLSSPEHYLANYNSLTGNSRYTVGILW